ncbi:MAG: beta-1,4-glucuronosyltransferase WelK [Chakrabartia sp.]
MAAPASGLKICLAASGGGHVRQLLDLAPVWDRHDHFFVTEDTALGRSIARTHRTHFVDHVALGQARLGRPGAMLGSAARNFAQSIAAIARERPDLVLSTGAGAVFFACLAARLTGARFILIDSFARFQAPSAFARIARPLAHRLIVQSAALQARWPKALVFDPLTRLTGPVPLKDDLIFVTVGATLGFDRLIDTVAALKRAGEISERVIFQIGSGHRPGALPADCEVVTDLDFTEVQALLQHARIVITHGGTGSLVTALRAGCNVIAMPRLFARGEHYDDHQSEIIQAFVARGLILAAEDTDALAAALPIARTRMPTPATTDPSALRDYLTGEIARLDQ